MPGNPLPKIEINASRWPYDENGPVNGKFGDVEVTAAPRSILDASNPSETLTGTKGYLQYTTGETAVNTMPNVEIPNTGGERGFEYTVQGSANPEHYAQGRKIEYTYLLPSDHIFIRMKVYQPINLKVRRSAKFYLNDLSEVSGWEVGDSLSTSEGVSGVVYYIGLIDNVPTVHIDNYLGGSPELRLDAGTVINNDTKSLSATSSGTGVDDFNAKFITDWVGEGNGEYSYGGMHLGFKPTSITGSDLSNNGMAKFSGSIVDSGGGGSHGDQSNQLGPQAVVFDLDDNGEIVDFVVEKKRSTAEGANDGEYRLWKKVYKAGHQYENWTLVFERTGVFGCWSPHSNNEFQKGYFWGNKNGAYEEGTTFYTMRIEYWDQKPTFLTEAGV